MVTPMLNEYSPELVTDVLSLNFANTVGDHKLEAPNEHIDSYRALVAWCQQVGILSKQTSEDLIQEGSRRENEASRVLKRAITLREAIYRIFSAISADKETNPGDLAILNKFLSAAMARSRLIHSGKGYKWDWEPEKGALDQMLWPIARSAADLLTSEELTLVRECANDSCGWLFVDTSRNHSRRWCSMNDCGNRLKARRHYARMKKAG